MRHVRLELEEHGAWCLCRNGRECVSRACRCAATLGLIMVINAPLSKLEDAAILWYEADGRSVQCESARGAAVVSVSDALRPRPSRLESTGDVRGWSVRGLPTLLF